MKTKRILYLLIILFILIGGTFIVIETKRFIKDRTFTQEKWATEPDKRFIIVSDMLKKHNFANMSKEQVFNLLGKPEGFAGTDGFPIRTFDRSKPVGFRNSNSVCYITETGEITEDYSGFYVQFDNDGKVIDFAIVHFTT